MLSGIDVGGDFILSCAPEVLSIIGPGEREVWLNNATDFGQVDFMDPQWVPSIVEVHI